MGSTRTSSGAAAASAVCSSRKASADADLKPSRFSGTRPRRRASSHDRTGPTGASPLAAGRSARESLSMAEVHEARRRILLAGAAGLLVPAAARAAQGGKKEKGGSAGEEKE